MFQRTEIQIFLLLNVDFHWGFSGNIKKKIRHVDPVRSKVPTAP